MAFGANSQPRAGGRRYRTIAGKRTAPEGRRKKWGGKDFLLLALIVIMVASVGTAIWAVKTRSPAAQPDKQGQEETAEPVEKLTDSIDLPGYGWIPLASGKLEQEQTFPNPPQNFCWIRMSLLLEDGTNLWTSELVAPGESSEPVVLSQTLEPGEYKNAVLKYECFRMDDELSPLNGGEVHLTLKVK